MRHFLALLIALSAALTGCNDVYLSRPPDLVGDDDDAFPEFDGATLRVVEPVSAAIYLTEEPFPLVAEVVGADGEVLDFDGVTWTSDQFDDDIGEGADTNVDLPYGMHAITATAELPNGDRLQSTMGGIRVQGVHTGVYAGSMDISVALDFQGTPINAQCAGGLDFVVDMSGEVLGGGGNCSVNLVVIDGFDINYEVNADVLEDDTAEGDVGIDIGFFALPIGFTGEFVEEGRMEATFDGQIVTFALDGQIQANRVSLYVDP